ncbi:MAG: FAD-binding protein, partial [Thaumarchaeota archaeon]|nr:FAD-binding protein [Nitrososphaerota archaeon]
MVWRRLRTSSWALCLWSSKSPAIPVDTDDRSYQEISCDALIIGAGGAGLRAAIEAQDRGSKTLIVCKSLLGKAHTVMAEGGIAAALGDVDAADGWESHFSDTVIEGQNLSNWRMVEIFAKEAI